MLASRFQGGSVRGRSIRILPGQYYDAETGTHYNYYRDYDPTIGRYIESDPIGIHGGLNTYQYGRASPLNYIDPSGLWPVQDDWQSSPPGRCSWSRYDELVTAKNRECGTTHACGGDLLDCAEIARRVNQGYACLAARLAVMNECFGGGDEVHKRQVQQTRQAIRNCLDQAQRARCCGP